MDLRWTEYRDALRRLAAAEERLNRAEGEYRQAALRAAGSQSEAVLENLARCELRERRARATATRARTGLIASRRKVLGDRAAVPVQFRRRLDLEPRVISLYGRAAPEAVGGEVAAAATPRRRRTVS